ncbi:helix-turn-helix domain-containing protein [Streptomyces sp. NBC_00124]|uniref:hypothetical protein n=1 Tax=Streptomyces sp. NBC_00124 TaxID=2975662 RepID=UPI00224EB5FA|nr:hypothetical protein [Streptomyces sp. NBC_00124]MCX5357862.1 helix-turn-helix domain-containing protein [Streptomyces sp. NBC_00124]
MNTGEHAMDRDEDVHDEQTDRIAALTELRRKLNDGLARARLNKAELAGRVHLGRTTVSEALLPDRPVPSARTVAVLAHALKLPVGELLELRRIVEADEVSGAWDGSGPGRPIGEWEPHALEIHPAGPGGGSPELSALPSYVRGKHDRYLDAAVQDAAQGSSRMTVLVGTSSTGKTRACWEAVQLLAVLGWRLWHPFHPAPAEAALEGLHRVQPRTVVWLNEAQRYLGDPQAGERIAAAVHALLIRPERGPVLVLGTMWPEYAAQYTVQPAPHHPDPYSRARELLAGRTLAVPETFDVPALAAAATFAKAGDRLLADALTRAEAEGRVTQDLAGAPELLRRYQDAAPGARAVMDAAMDAHRLGGGLRLPQEFLTDAATDYLSDTNYDLLSPDWAEQAFAELARPVKGKQAPLRRTALRPQRRPPGTLPPASAPPAAAGLMLRLADYLEQHGRTTRWSLCPKASFWHAAHGHLTSPSDLDNLAQAAYVRHRPQWAHHLAIRAIDVGSIGAMGRLSEWREEAGDQEGAEVLAGWAADAGSTDALRRLAEMRKVAGDWEGAVSVLRRAADAGSVDALRDLARTQEAAEALAQGASDRDGWPPASWDRRQLWGAEYLAREAAEAGAMFALSMASALKGIDVDEAEALQRLVASREETGDRERAENLVCRSADAGSSWALYVLAWWREKAGDRDGAEPLYQRAADYSFAAHRLAWLREKAGDRDGAETVARRAARVGHTDALILLARNREEAGDQESAELLYQRAADAGKVQARIGLRAWGLIKGRWPYGLDPDGTPTPRWKASIPQRPR